VRDTTKSAVAPVASFRNSLRGEFIDSLPASPRNARSNAWGQYFNDSTHADHRNDRDLLEVLSRLSAGGWATWGHNPVNRLGAYCRAAPSKLRIAHRLLAASLALAGKLDEARDVTNRRDRVQTTTLREIGALRLFRQDEVMSRYLAAQRLCGVAE
jgi:hypothetical protein